MLLLKSFEHIILAQVSSPLEAITDVSLRAMNFHVSYIKAIVRSIITYNKAQACA